MRFGVIFPHDEIGNDPAVLREFAQTADATGFDFLGVFDHVIGAHPDRFVGNLPGYERPPYIHENAFHEVFTLLAFFTAVTTRIELQTAVLVLPQRQTALVAKQAAEIAILSGDRLQLGVGLGWNFTEYEGLNEDFHTRGRRVEEQIAVLRKLWTEPLVTFEGRWHHYDRIGIHPRPARPIPIWMGGGTSDRLLQRTARLADGWMPNLSASKESERILARLRGMLEAEGRDPANFGIQSSIGGLDRPIDDWVARARRWQELGISQLGISLARSGVSPLQALARAAEIRSALAETISAG